MGVEVEPRRTPKLCECTWIFERARVPLKCDHCIVAYGVYIVYRIAGSKSLERVFKDLKKKRKKSSGMSINRIFRLKISKSNTSSISDKCDKELIRRCDEEKLLFQRKVRRVICFPSRKIWPSRRNRNISRDMIKIAKVKIPPRIPRFILFYPPSIQDEAVKTVSYSRDCATSDATNSNHSKSLRFSPRVEDIFRANHELKHWEQRKE